MIGLILLDYIIFMTKKWSQNCTSYHKLANISPNQLNWSMFEKCKLYHCKFHVAGVCKCSEGDFPPCVLRLRPMRSDRRSGRLPPGGRTDLLRKGWDVLRFIYMYWKQTRKRSFFFELYWCSMWTLYWILYEPIWKQCRLRFRFWFRSNKWTLTLRYEIIVK